MKVIEFDDMAFAGGEIISFIKKKFDKSRVIVSSSISETNIYENDVTIKGLQNRLIKILEKFDALSGELTVTENDGDFYFDFTPDGGKEKFIGRKIKFEVEKDYRIEDFLMSGGPRELYIKNKKDYLEKNSPLDEHKDFDGKKKCLICGSVFMVKEYKVIAGPEIDYISCPYYPNCDGDILDWSKTDESVREGESVYLNKVERETEGDLLKAQEQYLDRYYGFREVDKYRVKENEGIVVYFCSRNKSLLQLVVVKASMDKKFGKIIEKRIKEEQSMGFMPDDGLTPSILFLKADNMEYMGDFI
jgi:hypothetical protein